MNKLGSHWRCRVVLGVILFATAVAATQQLRLKVDRRMIGGVGGPPILTGALGRNSQSIEAWDPSTGKPWVVLKREWDESSYKSLQCKSIRGGQAIAFVEASSLLVVPTAPPYRETAWRLPEPVFGEYMWVCDVSPDERFGVIEVAFRSYGFSGTPPFPGPTTVFVVELATQRIVSSVQDAQVFPRGAGGEYVLAQDPQGKSTFTNFYRRLNEQGEWVDSTQPTDVELLFSKKGFFKAGAEGVAQVVPADDTTPARYPLGVRVWQMSPTDDHYLIHHHDGFYLGDLSSAQPLALRRLDVPRDSIGPLVSAWFQNDGNAISFVDSWSDIFQLDLRNGQVQKIGSPGTDQYRRMMAFTVAFLALAAAYGWLAFSEQSLSWALADAVPIAWIAMGIAVVARISHIPLAFWEKSPLQLEVARWNGPFCAGILFASVYAAAWYWAYGQGMLLQRIAFAALALVGVTVPLASTLGLYNAYRPPLQASPEWLTGMTAAQAMLLAVLLSLPRWLGWCLQRSVEIPANTGRSSKTFSLATMFTIVAFVAIGLALDRAIDLRRLMDFEMWYFTRLLVPFSPTLGVLLPLVLTAKTRRVSTVLAIALAIGLVVEVVVIATPAIWSPWNHVRSTLVGHLIASSSGAIFVLLPPCILVRLHGYRWYRATGVAGPQEQAVAVA